jgi:type VI secretion system protein ImpG
MATDFKTTYATELRRLRQYSQEFARANPALAPSLGAVSSDPDVERLLEGVAYLNGLTLQKLDDEFPEIAQELAGMLEPQILRPVPAATMVVFEPKAALKEPAIIKAGTELASNPIDDVSCKFRTSTDLIVNQLALNSAQTDQLASGDSIIRLEFKANATSSGVDLPDTIRLFLGEIADTGSTIMMLLQNYTKSISIVDGHGNRFDISGSLQFPGFNEPLLPLPKNGIPAFGLIRELLSFPEKFMFVEFVGINKKNVAVKTEVFAIEIRLSKSTHAIPQLSAKSFILHVTPALNLFNLSAEPIHLDHETHEYLVLPDGLSRKHHQIFSLDSVKGVRQGQAKQIKYQPFSLFQFGSNQNESSYRTTVRQANSGDWVETFISVAYPINDIPVVETLSIEMTCTNRWLPESLKLGDVCRPTNSSPERCSFRNISPIKGAVDVLTDEALLWAFIGHTTMNFMSLGSIETLRSLLRLYVGFRTNDHASRATNDRQIDGILALRVLPETRLYRGSVVQGQSIHMQCDQSNWSSVGSMYLWGCVLARFFASYATINVYTRFELTDRNTGVEFKWPPMLGNKPLI